MKYLQRLESSRRNLERSSRRLEKAREERVWIERNPHIHILNYPFYKLIRIIILKKKQWKRN